MSNCIRCFDAIVGDGTEDGDGYICAECRTELVDDDEANPAPPPATNELLKPTNVSSSGSDEERARIQSNSLGRGVDTMWADVYRQGALWGLRTSQASLSEALKERDRTDAAQSAEILRLAGEVDRLSAVAGAAAHLIHVASENEPEFQAHVRYTYADCQTIFKPIAEAIELLDIAVEALGDGEGKQ